MTYEETQTKANPALAEMLEYIEGLLEDAIAGYKFMENYIWTRRPNGLPIDTVQWQAHSVGLKEMCERIREQIEMLTKGVAR